MKFLSSLNTESLGTWLEIREPLTRLSILFFHATGKWHAPSDLFQDRQSAATQQPMTNRHARPGTVRELAKSLSGIY
jgi:hypothetical protein